MFNIWGRGAKDTTLLPQPPEYTSTTIYTILTIALVHHDTEINLAEVNIYLPGLFNTAQLTGQIAFVTNDSVQ